MLHSPSSMSSRPSPRPVDIVTFRPSCARAAPPLAAGPGVELLDLVLVTTRPPPLREQLGIGVGPENELSRRVKHDSRDELLLAGLDHVLGLRHRDGLLRLHRFSPS